MDASGDARAAGERVDRLLAQLRSGPDPRAAAVAEDLVRCLVQLYGEGLERIVRLVGPQWTQLLCADPLVESLMLVHDLHPLDPDTRIRLALDRIGLSTPDAIWHGIDADGVAHVTVVHTNQADGRGCRSAVRATVDAAIAGAAPEVAGVVVDVASPSPLLQISLRPGLGAAR